MKRILIAGLVMICLSVTASAQKTSDKQVQKDRIEKTFKKGGDGKIDKSRSGKDGKRHKMEQRHDRKKGYAKKYSKHKMQGKKFKKGHTSRFKAHGQKNRS